MDTTHKSYLYWFAGLALGVWGVACLMNRRKGDKEATKVEAMIDDAAEDSFPASDPPAWTGTHV